MFFSTWVKSGSSIATLAAASSFMAISSDIPAGATSTELPGMAMP